jgi:hypothetical protein
MEPRFLPGLLFCYHKPMDTTSLFILIGLFVLAVVLISVGVGMRHGGSDSGGGGGGE